MTGIALGALALLVFSIPSENGVAIPGVGSVSRLIGLVAIALALVSLYDRDRLRFRTPSLFLIIAAAFVGWAVLTYFWSFAPAVSLSRGLQYIQLLAFAWMVHQLAQTDRDRDLLMQAFVLGCYVMIMIALVASFGPGRAGYRDVVFPANSFAIVAALAIPMSWGLMVRRPFPLFQVLNVVYPIFALVAVVLAASRGGLLTAVVGLAIIPLSLPHLSHLRRAVLLVTVSAVALATFVLLPQAVPDIERNLDRLGRVDEDLIDGTMTGRTNIWAAGVEVFRTSPIVGVGVGAYSRAVEPILGSARGAHNAFLSVVVTTGSIGLLLFIAMFLIVLVGLLAHPVRRPDYLVLFGALLVGIMPANAENNKFLWYSLAVLASARPVMVEVGSTIVRRRIVDASSRQGAKSSARHAP